MIIQAIKAEDNWEIKHGIKRFYSVFIVLTVVEM